MSTYSEHHLWSFDPVLGQSRCATSTEIANKTFAFHQEQAEYAREKQRIDLEQRTKYEKESIGLSEEEKTKLWHKIIGWKEIYGEIFHSLPKSQPKG